MLTGIGILSLEESLAPIDYTVEEVVVERHERSGAPLLQYPVEEFALLGVETLRLPEDNLGHQSPEDRPLLVARELARLIEDVGRPVHAPIVLILSPCANRVVSVVAIRQGGCYHYKIERE